MGNVDSEPIPNLIVAEDNNRALCGQIIPDQMAWVSTIRGNTKAALDIFLPLACTWRKMEALLRSGLGPLLWHPRQCCENYFCDGHQRRRDIERGDALPRAFSNLLVMGGELQHRFAYCLGY
jgi:hypothetical protein